MSVCSATGAFSMNASAVPNACMSARVNWILGGYNISQVPVKDYEHNFQT